MEPQVNGQTLSAAKLPIGILLIDASGVIQEANEHAKGMFSGSGEAELVGQEASRLLPIALHFGSLPEGHALVGPGLYLSAARLDGSRFSAIVRVRKLDGLLALLVDECPPSPRPARSSEAHVSRLFERARVIPWEASVESFQFTYVGPQAEVILGYPVAAWFEQDFWPKHIHPSEREMALQKCISCTRDQDNFEIEYRMLAADGREVWILDVVTVVRAQDGSPRFIAGYMLDVTERKRALLEQQRLVGELNEALQARDEFISVASHELRGPLTPMKLQLQVLERRLKEAGIGPCPELEKALGQLGRLTQLIGLLLDVTRAAAGKLTLNREAMDLTALVEAVAAGFSEEAQQAGTPIVLLAAPQVVGEWDRLRLEQVVTNLLSNALKFGAGMPIEVRLAQQPTSVRLSVRDQGQGIAPADQERIFERFTRLSAARRARGLGLGLYLSREIVGAHQGRIWVESTPGKGSTFQVELPLRGPSLA